MCRVALGRDFVKKPQEMSTDMNRLVQELWGQNSQGSSSWTLMSVWPDTALNFLKPLWSEDDAGFHHRIVDGEINGLCQVFSTGKQLLCVCDDVTTN